MKLLNEIKVLKQQGKIHDTLIKRTRLLFLLASTLFLLVVWNISKHDIRGNTLFFIAIFATVGFFLGFYILSQADVINWSEKEEVKRISNMDAIGLSGLGLYVFLESLLRTFLKEYIPSLAAPFLLAGVFGIVLGRALSTLIKIHRVYVTYHQRKQGPLLGEK